MEPNHEELQHRLQTSHLRSLPNFIIIGAQRSGTTSLFNYLAQHPGIAPSFTKEVHFFDYNFGKRIDWYRAHFPIKKQGQITGEASPYYIFHPLAPYRTAQNAAHTKIIAILRNPVDRAYSHYWHEVRAGAETLPFEEAIEREPERIRGEEEKMVKDEDYYSFNHQHFSYLSRGIYVEQLRLWMSLFTPESFLVIGSEDLFSDTDRTLCQVLDFLNVPAFAMKAYMPFNSSNYPKLNVSTRKRLADYFAPHNEHLCEYLDRDFKWNI